MQVVPKSATTYMTFDKQHGSLVLGGVPFKVPFKRILPGGGAGGGGGVTFHRGLIWLVVPGSFRGPQPSTLNPKP